MKIWFDGSITEYDSDEGCNAKNPLEVKRVNFFVGANNAGKSRLIRLLYQTIMTREVVFTFPFSINELKSYFQDISKNLIDTIEPLTSFSIVIDPVTNEEKREIIFNHLLYRINIELNITVFKYEQLDSQLSDQINKLFKNKEYLSAIQEIVRKINIKFNFPYFISTYTPIMRSLSNIYSNPQELENKKKDYYELFRSKSIYSRYGNDRESFDINIQKYHDSYQRYPLIRKVLRDYNVALEDLITGEDLFEEITIVSLGSDEEISNFENFKKKLSKYFFNGENIRIVPNKKEKVIQIKIGKQPQFPITELGDGLQQIIILSYKAFLTTKPICFCIEEPEMHLHAGYQRQLIKFLLNETPHYYFFTTHSNHFLDMTTEDERIALYRIDKKEVLKEGKTEFQKVVRRCDQDNDILSVLGVRPSSVFLANCTIWVEGITDRLYLSAYMKKYLQEIKESEPEKYAEYSKYIDGYHYAFVEYQGSNLAHWSFDDVADVESTDDNGLKAKAIASNALLIADGDVSNKARMKTIRQQLGMNCFELSCKETENTLPKNILEQVYFNWLPEDGEKKERNYTKMDSNEYHKYSFDMPTNYQSDVQQGVGFYLDEMVKQHFPKLQDGTHYQYSSGGQATVKNKTKFCRDAISFMNNEEFNWILTNQAKEICEEIFQHIKRHNSDEAYENNVNEVDS